MIHGATGSVWCGALGGAWGVRGRITDRPTAPDLDCRPTASLRAGNMISPPLPRSCGRGARSRIGPPLRKWRPNLSPYVRRAAAELRGRFGHPLPPTGPMPIQRSADYPTPAACARHGSGRGARAHPQRDLISDLRRRRAIRPTVQRAAPGAAAHVVKDAVARTKPPRSGAVTARTNLRSASAADRCDGRDLPHGTVADGPDPAPARTSAPPSADPRQPTSRRPLRRKGVRAQSVIAARMRRNASRCSAGLP